MTYEELQAKIADIESLIDLRYKKAMDQYHKYWCECIESGKVVVKTRPTRALYERQANEAIDRVKKEYAMENSPADVGDIIKSGKWVMRVERIEAAAFEQPTLRFYGTFLNRRTLEPLRVQHYFGILQNDIEKVIKSNPTNF